MLTMHAYVYLLHTYITHVYMYCVCYTYIRHTIHIVYYSLHGLKYRKGLGLIVN